MPTSLIVGCGYLGRRVASLLLERGGVVYGTTRNPDKARRLAEMGVRPMLVHVTQPLTLAALVPALDAPHLDVYYMVPPGRPDRSPSPRQTVLGGIGHVVKALRGAKVRRGVLVSSTAVYGQRGGEVVDADTPAKPIEERGRLLLDGERLWQESGEARHVVRLAGLYGPGRVIGRRALESGAPLVGDPRALLNLVHVEDAARLLVAVMDAEHPGQVEVGCDGHPVARERYYEHLAGLLNVSPPTVLDDARAAAQLGVDMARLRLVSSKALDNGVTCRRTGWQVRFSTFREGLDSALAGRG